jgi:hypothetical protein
VCDGGGDNGMEQWSDMSCDRTDYQPPSIRLDKPVSTSEEVIATLRVLTKREHGGSCTSTKDEKEKEKHG